jgi:hypothetical protein
MEISCPGICNFPENTNIHMITVSDESIDKVFEFLDNLDEEAAYPIRQSL